MSADVVTLTPQPTHDERAKRAEQTFREAYSAIEERVRGLGWPTHIGTPMASLFQASLRHAELWQRRAAKLSRQLQAALATDALSDEQRAEIIRALTGNTRRDAKLLTASEREYLDDLHALADADRAAVRRIARALARKGDA